MKYLEPLLRHGTVFTVQVMITAHIVKNAINHQQSSLSIINECFLLERDNT